MSKRVVDVLDELVTLINGMSLDGKVAAINEAKKTLHSISPFSDEPVDCVLWVKTESIGANDYNPNSVAPPEMRLLQTSIDTDGYTQPVVAWDTGDNNLEVVDGFHRTRVAKECSSVRNRVHGYVPVAIIKDSQTGRNERIAATIRHNRARGKHAVSSMSDIVVELKRRNWSDERIARELGMDQDEILRLCQITGLAELFSDTDFSRSWDVEGYVTPDDFTELTDDTTTYGDEVAEFRTVNTSDSTRVFHTYDQWECHKAGFYDTAKKGLTKQKAEEMFREVLTDATMFSNALDCVISQWVKSCEHYLTNAAMNRLAWLGQAAVCYAKGVPSAFRSGWSTMTEQQQNYANEVALRYLNKWLVANGREQVTMEEACPDRQSEIY